MKKRIASVLMAVLMLLSLMPTMAFGEDGSNIKSGSCGPNATWTLDEQGHMSITGTGKMDDYNTGIYIDTGEMVNKEPCPWKDYMSDITSLTIGEGITSVGYMAFSKAVNMESVVLPETLKTIENDAFNWCRSLKEVIIPDACEKIGAMAFYACTSLERAVIGSGVKEIGAGVFNWAPLKAFELSADNTVYKVDDGMLMTKDGKTLVAYPGERACDVYTIPSTVESIPISLFEGVANGPKEIVIPSSVTKIGSDAFEYMESLEKITIPASVTDLGSNYTFYGCTNLKEITILANVDTIPYGFAAECSSLESVVLPDSVTTIDTGAFNGCQKLSKINVPQNLITIGRIAFTYCNALVDFPFPNSVTYIGDHAFYESGITEMPAWLEQMDDGSYAKLSQMEFTVTYNQTKARDMLSLINDMRTGGDAWIRNQNGDIQNLGVLNALEYDYDLEQIAMQRAKEIAVYFSHTRPDGESCFGATYNGTSSNGENICAGSNTAEGAFEIWCETDQPYSGQGHRRSMLDPEWTSIGIASVTVHGMTYWVQEFGVSNSGAAVTSADDSEKTVTVNFTENAVADVRIILSEDSMTVDRGTSAALPTATVETVLSEGWYSRYEKCTDDLVWESSDTSVVSIEDGKIMALQCGTATLTASALGTTAEVLVTVPHTWDTGKVTEEPTETTTGIKTFTCEGCGATRTETIPMLVHTHSYTATVTEPTYTEKGYTTHSCTCGDSYVDSYVPALCDFNGDETVDEADLTILLRHVAKIDSVTDEELLTKLDINKDGCIDAVDVTELAQALQNK